MSHCNQPARPEGSGRARHQPAPVPDLPTDAPDRIGFGPRCSSSATVDPTRPGPGPGPGAGPLRSGAAEATWENEGGRLLRAIRLDQYAAAAHGAEPEAHTHPLVYGRPHRR